MADHSLHNGLPPQISNLKQNTVQDTKSQYQFNGVHSSQSSRDSSPIPRVGIPSSQLPPSRVGGGIPQSQLPPSRSPLTTLTQKVDHMKITPNVSPKITTSTPNQTINLTGKNNFGVNSAFSPIVSKPELVLDNVPLNGGGVSVNNNNGGPGSNTQQPPQRPVYSQSHTSLPPGLSGQSAQKPTMQPSSSHPKLTTPVSQGLIPNAQFSTQNQLKQNNPSVYSSTPNLSQPFGQVPRSSPQNLPKAPQPNGPIATFPQPHQNVGGIMPNSGQQKPFESVGYVPQSNGPFPGQQSQNVSTVNQNFGYTNQQPSNGPGGQNFFTPPINQFRGAQKAPLSLNQNFVPPLSTGPHQSLGGRQNLPPQNVPSSTVGNGPFAPKPPSSQGYAPPVSSGPVQPPNQFGSVQNPPFIAPQPPNATPSYQTGIPPRSANNLPPQPTVPPNRQFGNFVGPPNQQNIQQPTLPNSNLPTVQQNQFNKASLHSNRYPTSPIQQQNMAQPPAGFNNFTNQQQAQNQFSQPTPGYQPQSQQYQSVSRSGYDKFWGTENYDLLQNPHILPPTKIEPPRVSLGQELLDQANCSPDIFRCTMTKIPENNTLLQKSRLPLGVLIHPFRDLNHLPVIQCNVIVRCRACRTYINPFVYFVDSKRWKCNLCYRINELPEEFQYDPVTKTYGDPSRRPEIKSSTIEYIAPAEYMLRPPQPAVYLYLLDISKLAIESEYLHSFCSVLKEELKNIPGDARTQIGFIAYDSCLHFFSLGEGLSQPHEMTVLDIDDVFLPCPDNLLVNLKDRMELVDDLLTQLPSRYLNSYDNNSALGAALQAAYKMMGTTGGRVTVFQASLPNVGPGSLTAREDPSQRASADVAHLNPANDFYKRLALECSGQQIAVDLFVVNSQYVDIATISGISRFSGGCIHHFPLFKASRTLQNESFERCFRRYLTRKIGFEAVMRIRCTRGLSIHTFHGNFFVRSTDLLSLPNVNPDAGYGMQVSIDESLSDVQTVCFQAALLYTSSKGERRIRVHTICLPVVASLHDVIHSADQQCILGLLAKMAVDRSMQSSLSDAREAFINVAIDILSSYKLMLNVGAGSSGLLAPNCLKVLPLYISALLKHVAFRIGVSTRLDDRVKAMVDMKTKPLYQLIQQVYPDLYPVHNLGEQEVILNSEEEPVYLPPKLQLTARCLENRGAFLMDTGDNMIILVGPNAPLEFLNEGLGVPDYNAITDQMYELPVLNNQTNQRLHHFIQYLNEDKPCEATLQIIRDNSPNRAVFLERLIEDRGENSLSYHEFLQHLKSQVK